jgi:sigma-E factor negative regulatory protein RseA
MKLAVKQPMNNELNEKISALMDDELHLDANDALLGDAKSQVFRDAWSRQHLIRDTMQNELSSAIDEGFSARISELIDKEKPLSAVVVEGNFAAKPKKQRQWLKPLGGFALAASVAALSVVGLRSMQSPPSTSTAEQIATLAPVEPRLPLQGDSSNFKRVNNTGTYWKVGRSRIKDAKLELRLNQYLSDHIEFATMRNVGGVLVYSKVVAYDE